jgi:hypothetical protein
VLSGNEWVLSGIADYFAQRPPGLLCMNVNIAGGTSFL